MNHYVVMERTDPPDLLWGPLPDEDQAVAFMEHSNDVDGEAQTDCLECYTSTEPPAELMSALITPHPEDLAEALAFAAARAAGEHDLPANHYESEGTPHA